MRAAERIADSSFSSRAQAKIMEVSEAGSLWPTCGQTLTDADARRRVFRVSTRSDWPATSSGRRSERAELKVKKTAAAGNLARRRNRVFKISQEHVSSSPQVNNRDDSLCPNASMLSKTTCTEGAEPCSSVQRPGRLDASRKRDYFQRLVAVIGVCREVVAWQLTTVALRWT